MHGHAYFRTRIHVHLINTYPRPHTAHAHGHRHTHSQAHTHTHTHTHTHKTLARAPKYEVYPTSLYLPARPISIAIIRRAYVAQTDHVLVPNNIAGCILSFYRAWRATAIRLQKVRDVTDTSFCCCSSDLCAFLREILILYRMIDTNALNTGFRLGWA